MKYRELIIHISASDIETVTNVVSMLNFGGMYIEDYTDLLENEIVKQVGLIDEGLLNKDRNKAAIHIYIDEYFDIGVCYSYLKERFEELDVSYVFEEGIVDEEDYANAWKQYYKPFRVGKNIVVVPEWDNYKQNGNETILKMNPGMAFGSGTHETTFMCMEALQDYVRVGHNVLDVGCGSGILSITALLSGAKNATAIDIDKNAVRITNENAEMNGVGDRLQGYYGNLLDLESEVSTVIRGNRYDMIVSNIIAEIVIRLSDLVDSMLTNGGFFILSGIILDKREEVLQALVRNKLSICEVREKNGWVCLVAQK